MLLKFSAVEKIRKPRRRVIFFTHIACITRLRNGCCVILFQAWNVMSYF